MIGFTQSERATLNGLAVAAIVGFGLLLWQRSHEPLHLTMAPPISTQQVWDQALAHARTIDVNTADVGELEQLPGVGPSLAIRIVAYRETHGRFSAASQLQSIKGIGPKIFEKIESYIRVD